MDIIDRYKVGLEQLKKTKAFFQELNPVDYELISFMNTLDAKITKAEDMVNSLRGGFGSKDGSFRCGICDRKYEEDPIVIVDAIKVCPVCREQGGKWKPASTWEDIYDLPQGTIKRDCYSKEGQPAKLQSYIDAGLIQKAGIHQMIHEQVMRSYYLNPERYKRRKTRN